MSTQFKPGKSGNPRGRPAGKVADLTPPELRAVLSKLKKISPEAVDMMISAMQDGTLSQAVNLKYAEKLFGMYLMVLRESERMKQLAKDPSSVNTDDGVDKPAPVVLQLTLPQKKS